MRMAELFFLGAKSMRVALVNAIKARREERDISVAELDRRCGFGADGLPSVSDFEADSSKMTSRVFSRASFALGLNIDDVLKVDLGDKLQQVVEHMKLTNSGVAAASSCPEAGHRSGVQLSFEQQAPVYVILKALEEMDGHS